MAANRQNAQKSTGPISFAGRLMSRRNAWKHGLTAKAIVYRGEDAEAFHTLEVAIIDELQPVGALEAFFAQRIAVAIWQVWRSWEFEVDAIECVRASMREDFKKAKSQAPEGAANQNSNSEKEATAAAMKGPQAAEQKSGTSQDESDSDIPRSAAFFALARAQTPRLALLLRYRLIADGTIPKALNELRKLQAARKSKARSGEDNKEWGQVDEGNPDFVELVALLSGGQGGGTS
jgi:hypothetical protein